MKYFENCTNEIELKDKYKYLYFQNSKDAGIMAAINQELKEARETLSAPAPVIPAPENNQEPTQKAKKAPLSEDQKKQVNNAYIFAQTLPGCIVELCEAFIWVTGETKQSKDLLAAYGFKFSFKKVAWYFTPLKYFRSKNNYSLPQIYSKYKKETDQNNK